MQRFLAYWQACAQLEYLHAITPQHVAASCTHVSRAECVNGKIGNPIALQTLETGTVVVIPTYARCAEQYFFPYMLLAELNAAGELSVLPQFNLPLLPHSVLEPAALCPISMGQAEQFNDYIAINPPDWLDDAQLLTWHKLLDYAEQLVNEANTHWRNDLAQQQFIVQDDVLIAPLNALRAAQVDQLAHVDLSILKKRSKITLIDAPRNSGQSTHAKHLIIEAWIQAALKQADPPRHVWLQGGTNQALTYASIFSCMAASSVAHSDYNVHAELSLAYETYMQGQQALRNWQDVNARIADKYLDKGGITQRITQLQASLKTAKAQNRHLQVLYSIWIRQKELLTDWAKVFDFMPLLQKQRLARLYHFFKQNFPDDKVVGFSQSALDDLMLERVRRAENNERMIADALHQVENDQHQADIVRDKCLQWCVAQQLTATDELQIGNYLQNDLWSKLAWLTLRYWQQDFNAKQGHANFLYRYPEQIDILIVEHAEYVAPMLAAQLLTRSKRVVIMGSYNALCNPRFAVHIDYQLAKHFGIAANDADFEDLQFDGILGSVGNMWNMVAKDREADQIFSAQDVELEYEFIDTQTPSMSYHGSKVNQGAVSVLLDWLHQHAAQRNDIAIYTCFSGQVQLLRSALHGTLFAQMPIYLMQEINIYLRSGSAFFLNARRS